MLSERRSRLLVELAVGDAYGACFEYADVGFITVAAIALAAASESPHMTDGLSHNEPRNRVRAGARWNECVVRVL